MKNITKVFGSGETKVNALSNISFSVKQGEFVLIIGPSGSGKSTLLNMIGLLDKPTSGQVIIDREDTVNFSDVRLSSFRNNKLGFVFQFSNLLPDLTVYENVVLPRKIQGKINNLEHDAKKLLRIVGLEKQIDKPGNNISGGQAQRAAIARGLITNPSIVLADEPTGNLDSSSAANIVNLMKDMCRNLNQTFIVVTHDREQFGNVDRIITIRDGRAFEEENLSGMMQNV